MALCSENYAYNIWCSRCKSTLLRADSTYIADAISNFTWRLCLDSLGIHAKKEN